MPVLHLYILQLQLANRLPFYKPKALGTKMLRLVLCTSAMAVISVAAAAAQSVPSRVSLYLASGQLDPIAARSSKNVAVRTSCPASPCSRINQRVTLIKSTGRLHNFLEPHLTSGIDRACSCQAADCAMTSPSDV